jgi:CRP-like cAMP-binding protein
MVSDSRLLAYRVERLEGEVREGFHNIELRMAASMLTREVYAINHEATLGRIGKLEAVNETRRHDRLAILLTGVAALSALIAGAADLVIHLAH